MMTLAFLDFVPPWVQVLGPFLTAISIAFGLHKYLMERERKRHEGEVGGLRDDLAKSRESHAKEMREATRREQELRARCDPLERDKDREIADLREAQRKYTQEMTERHARELADQEKRLREEFRPKNPGPQDLHVGLIHREFHSYNWEKTPDPALRIVCGLELRSLSTKLMRGAFLSATVESLPERSACKFIPQHRPNWEHAVDGRSATMNLKEGSSLQPNVSVMLLVMEINLRESFAGDLRIVVRYGCGAEVAEPPLVLRATPERMRQAFSSLEWGKNPKDGVPILCQFLGIDPKSGFVRNDDSALA